MPAPGPEPELFPEVPQVPEEGYQTRLGQECDCGVQVLGAAVCCWCGGHHPPLSPRLLQIKRELEQAAAPEPTGGE
jgi:hypothetical protein